MGNSILGGFQTLLRQQLVCPSHVAIAQLMSVTVLSLQTRLCFPSVTSLSLHWIRTRVSVPLLLSLPCAIVTWQTLCNDSNSSAQVCDGNSEIGHICVTRAQWVNSYICTALALGKCQCCIYIYICVCVCEWIHWGWDKMASILHMAFSNAWKYYNLNLNFTELCSQRSNWQ